MVTLIQKLDILNKKEFAEKFVKYSEDDNYPLDGESIDIIFIENIDDYAEDYYTEFSTLLQQYNMTTYHSNNMCWEYLNVGLFVKDYDNVCVSDLENVHSFCEKYGLGKATYFGGIFGEYE